MAVTLNQGQAADGKRVKKARVEEIARIKVEVLVPKDKVNGRWMVVINDGQPMIASIVEVELYLQLREAHIKLAKAEAELASLKDGVETALSRI